MYERLKAKATARGGIKVSTNFVHKFGDYRDFNFHKIKIRRILSKIQLQNVPLLRD